MACTTDRLAQSVVVTMLVACFATVAPAQCVTTGALPSTLPVMQGGSTAGAGDHATPVCNPGGDDNLWTYTATCDVAHTVSLCGSGYDTILNVFSGDPCLGGASLSCNDEACGLQSQVTVMMLAGTTYWILIDGYNGATGSYTLDITGTCPIPPCTVAGAIPSTAPISVSGDTSLTGRNEVIPSCAGNANDEVFTYVAPCDSTYTFSLCSGTATFDTVLEVFDGDPCQGAMSLGCNDDFCGAQSEVSIPMVMGEMVWIVVDGVGGATGPYDLDVTSTGCPCVIAGVIPSLLSVTQGGDTSLTGSDQILPSCTTMGGGDEEIWEYTAPCDATYTLSLCNGTASFDSVLAVFDGDPCMGGMEIACNNDSCGTQSELVIPLMGGFTYYLVVDSNAGGTGPYDLQITATGCVSAWLVDAPPCVPGGGFIDIPIVADSGVREQATTQWRLTWDPTIFSVDTGFGTNGIQFGTGWTGIANSTVPGELYAASWHLPPGPIGPDTQGTVRLIHSGIIGNTQIDGLVEIWTDQAGLSIATTPFFMTSATPAIGCMGVPTCNITSPMPGAMVLGTAMIVFDAMDPTMDPLDITYQYNAGGGFLPASRVGGGPSMDVGVAPAAGLTFDWDINADLFGPVPGVVFRITVVDASASGSTCTVTVDADIINQVPSCSITDPLPGALLMGTQLVTFDTADGDGNPLDLTYEFDAGGGFMPATRVGGAPAMDLGVPPAAGLTFDWDLATDVPGAAMGVVFRVTVDDGRAGGVSDCTVNIDVRPPNNPPGCNIFFPGAGSMLVADTQTVLFSTQDADGDPLDISYEFDAGGGFVPASRVGGGPSVDLGVPPSGANNFDWDIMSDIAVSTMGVVFRVTVDDGFGGVTSCTRSYDVVRPVVTTCTLCGDCNSSASGPDIIDSLTAAQIAVALISPTPAQELCCDVDSDMDTDVLDSLVIAQVAAGLPVSLTCR